MKDPFKNSLAPKERMSSRDFVAPTKEQATTGRFMSAGDYYGVGYNNPVGKFKPRPMKEVIPMESKCTDPNLIS